MTYQEYFKERKEEALRLLNFYGDLQRRITTGLENLEDRMVDTEIRIDEKKEELGNYWLYLENQIPNACPLLISCMTVFFQMPLLTLSSFILSDGYYELQKNDSPVRSKKLSQIKRESKILEFKKARLEKTEKQQNYRLFLLGEIIANLTSEVVYWSRLEELATGRLEQINDYTVEVGNKISSFIRGDLLTDTFGSAPVYDSTPTITIKKVD